MVEINEQNTDPGYLCGRLFQELENAQVTAARPSRLNATIADRYYGRASTAPQSVFPLLLNLARAHFHKMGANPRQQRARGAIENKISTIISKLDDFPKTLTLEQQGRFALGYYHQRAENSRQAREASAQQNDDNEPDAE